MGFVACCMVLHCLLTLFFFFTVSPKKRNWENMQPTMKSTALAKTLSAHCLFHTRSLVNRQAFPLLANKRPP